MTFITNTAEGWAGSPGSQGIYEISFYLENPPKHQNPKLFKPTALHGSEFSRHVLCSAHRLGPGGAKVVASHSSTCFLPPVAFHLSAPLRIYLTPYVSLVLVSTKSVFVFVCCQVPLHLTLFSYFLLDEINVCLCNNLRCLIKVKLTLQGPKTVFFLSVSFPLDCPFVGS